VAHVPERHRLDRLVAPGHRLLTLRESRWRRVGCSVLSFRRFDDPHLDYRPSCLIRMSPNVGGGTGGHGCSCGNGGAGRDGGGAAGEAISPNIQKLSVPEAQALVDRLYSRSLSTLFVASPEVRRDLCMASRAIRSMLSTIDRLASECEDRAHLVRAFHVDVGGC
jgi:hypothetical protein